VPSPADRSIAQPARIEEGVRVSPLPQGVRVSERLLGLPGLSNVGRIAPAIFRGAQPRPEGYQALKTMGIRTVINLRLRHSERQAVEAAGMRSIEIPMQTTKVNAETVRRVVALMTDPGNQPVFVHCAHGQDRTGIVVAVYRMEIDGWSNSEAEAEMQAFGFNDVWRALKAFVREYQAPGAGASRR
jgi:tyrosine-protein phosphatase SIW14